MITNNKKNQRITKHAFHEHPKFLDKNQRVQNDFQDPNEDEIVPKSTKFNHTIPN